jgi:threonine synthase
MTYVTKATCILCGTEHRATPQLTVCTVCGGILNIEYDYEKIKRSTMRQELAERDISMWRYRELLPIRQDSMPNTLRVGWSPLYACQKLCKTLGIKRLFIKDDGINPTSSLKDRASAIAVVKAKEAHATTIACASTGNAASSLAGNAAFAGLQTMIFLPERAPAGKIAQLLMFGANVVLVKGSYADAFSLSREAIAHWGWYNRNAAINPYLLEGKKTVSFEICEQLHWEVPDYVAVSVGDGCTIAGVWKGFCDLFSLGWIDRLPKLIAVQAQGCCPIVRSIQSQQTWSPMQENTLADSIAVGIPRNPDKAIRAINESRGLAVTVSDEQILNAMHLLGSSAGVFAEPAGAAGMAGLIKLIEEGQIKHDASVAVIVTGNGLKDIDNALKAVKIPKAIPPELRFLEQMQAQ